MAGGQDELHGRHDRHSQFGRVDLHERERSPQRAQSGQNLQSFQSTESSPPAQRTQVNGLDHQRYLQVNIELHLPGDAAHALYLHLRPSRHAGVRRCIHRP